MEVKKEINGGAATFALSGRLDTTTAPDFEKELDEVLPSLKQLTLDLQDLEYLSSAGLRIILKAQKAMNTQGTMTVKHVNETIMDVFDMTGFSSILNIED